MTESKMTLRYGPWAGGEHASEPLCHTVYAVGSAQQEPILLVPEAEADGNERVDRAKARAEAERLGVVDSIDWCAPILATGRLPRGQQYRPD